MKKKKLQIYLCIKRVFFRKNKKSGDVVGPIETVEAIFFIRIKSLQLATPIPFEKAAPELEEQLRREAIRKKRTEYGNSLRAKALIRYYI